MACKEVHLLMFAVVMFFRNVDRALDSWLCFDGGLARGAVAQGFMKQHHR